MSGGSCPRKEAVSVSWNPGPSPQSCWLLVTEELVPGAGDAVGLLPEATSWLPDALGEALGDLRVCWGSIKGVWAGLGELRAEQDADVRGDRSSVVDVVPDGDLCWRMRRSFSLSQSR